MTDERKNQFILAGALMFSALLLVFFFKTRGQMVQAIPSTDGSVGTPILSASPMPVGNYTTYNIAPYIPPPVSESGLTIGGSEITIMPPGTVASGGNGSVQSPTITVGSSGSAGTGPAPCPCPKICDMETIYYANENALYNNNTGLINTWMNNMFNSLVG